ncbi:MAG: hypothetical protein ACRDQF_19085, partial [Thermocrispum sp.]
MNLPDGGSRKATDPTSLTATTNNTKPTRRGPEQLQENSQLGCGTTTVPVAVVATIGSASIDAADADTSGVPRPTTEAV